MPFLKGSNITPKSKLKDGNTWPFSSACAPRRRRQSVPPDFFPGLLESDSDVKEITDELPKASESKRRISIARNYTDVLEAPPQR